MFLTLIFDTCRCEVWEFGSMAVASIFCKSVGSSYCDNCQLNTCGPLCDPTCPKLTACAHTIEWFEVE